MSYIVFSPIDDAYVAVYNSLNHNAYWTTNIDEAARYTDSTIISLEESIFSTDDSNDTMSKNHQLIWEQYIFFEIDESGVIDFLNGYKIGPYNE